MLDADDWSAPERLERQLEVLDRDPGVAVVGCRIREVDEQGWELAPRTVFAAGEVNAVLMRLNPIPNMAAAFRRDAALAAGGYDPRYRWAADYDLWLRLAERHRLVVVPSCWRRARCPRRNVAAQREREQIAEAIMMRLRAMRRRRSLSGAAGLRRTSPPTSRRLALKRARRRRLGQAP